MSFGIFSPGEQGSELSKLVDTIWLLKSFKGRKYRIDTHDASTEIQSHFFTVFRFSSEQTVLSSRSIAKWAVNTGLVSADEKI